MTGYPTGLQLFITAHISGDAMLDGKFFSLSREAQEQHVRDNFEHRGNSGWFTQEDTFAGATINDVIAALIDLEDATINAVGDCMSGFCVTPPKLDDFVRKNGGSDQNNSL